MRKQTGGESPRCLEKQEPHGKIGKSHISPTNLTTFSFSFSFHRGSHGKMTKTKSRRRERRNELDRRERVRSIPSARRNFRERRGRTLSLSVKRGFLINQEIFSLTGNSQVEHFNFLFSPLGKSSFLSLTSSLLSCRRPSSFSLYSLLNFPMQAPSRCFSPSCTGCNFFRNSSVFSSSSPPVSAPSFCKVASSSSSSSSSLLSSSSSHISSSSFSSASVLSRSFSPSSCLPPSFSSLSSSSSSSFSSSSSSSCEVFLFSNTSDLPPRQMSLRSSSSSSPSSSSSGFFSSLSFRSSSSSCYSLLSFLLCCLRHSSSFLLRDLSSSLVLLVVFITLLQMSIKSAFLSFLRCTYTSGNAVPSSIEESTRTLQSSQERKAPRVRKFSHLLSFYRPYRSLSLSFFFFFFLSIFPLHRHSVFYSSSTLDVGGTLPARGVQVKTISPLDTSSSSFPPLNSARASASSSSFISSSSSPPFSLSSSLAQTDRRRRTRSPSSCSSSFSLLSSPSSSPPSFFSSLSSSSPRYKRNRHLGFSSWYRSSSSSLFSRQQLHSFHFPLLSSSPPPLLPFSSSSSSLPFSSSSSSSSSSSWVISSFSSPPLHSSPSLPLSIPRSTSSLHLKSPSRLSSSFSSSSFPSLSSSTSRRNSSVSFSSLPSLYGFSRTHLHSPRDVAGGYSKAHVREREERRRGTSRLSSSSSLGMVFWNRLSSSSSRSSSASARKNTQRSGREESPLVSSASVHRAYERFFSLSRFFNISPSLLPSLVSRFSSSSSSFSSLLSSPQYLRRSLLRPLACLAIFTGILTSCGVLARRWINRTQEVYKQTFSFHVIRLLNRYLPSSSFEAEEKAGNFHRETQALHEEYGLDLHDEWGEDPLGADLSSSGGLSENAYLDLPSLSRQSHKLNRRNLRFHAEEEGEERKRNGQGIPPPVHFPPPPVDPTGFPRLREDLQLRRELTSLYEETVSRIPFFSHAMKMDLLQYTLEGLIQVSSGTDYTVHTLQFMQVLIEEAFKVPPLEVARLFRRMLEERKDASRSVSILLMGDCLLVQHPHLQQIIKPAWISYLHRGATDQTLDEEVLRRKEELYRNFVRYFLRRLFSQNLFAAFRLSSSSSVETVDDLHGQQRSDEASSEDSEIEDLLGSSKIFQTDEERRQIYFLSQLQKACEEHAERQEEEEERLQDEEREEEEEEGRESEGALEITNEKTERGREKKDEREEKTKKREREISQEDEIDIDDAERVLLLQESLLHTKASSSSYGDSSRHQEKERKEEEEEERPLRLLPLGLPKGWRFLSLKPRQAVRVLATEIRDCLEVIEEESAQRKKAIEDSDGETDNNAELKRLLEVTKDLFFFGAGRLLEVTFTREKSDELFHPPIEDHMETASNFFGESVKSLYSDLARKAEAEDDEEHRAALERQQTPPSERELAEDEMLKSAKEDKKTELIKNWNAFLSDLNKKKEQLQKHLLSESSSRRRRRKGEEKDASPCTTPSLSTHGYNPSEKDLSRDEKEKSEEGGTEEDLDVDPRDFTDDMLASEERAVATARAKQLTRILDSLYKIGKKDGLIDPFSSFSSSHKGRSGRALEKRRRSIGSSERNQEEEEERAKEEREVHEKKITYGYSPEAIEAGLPHKHCEKATRTLIALLQELEYRKFSVAEQAEKQREEALHAGDADKQLEQALGEGLDELDEDEEDEEEDSNASRKAFKTADREERIIQRQRALIEASKMKDQGAVHTAEELQCEVQEDERKNESPQHTRNDKKMLSPKEEENGKDKIETQQEEEKKVDSGRDAIGDSPMSMQEYLDKGYRLVFNTPYRVDEMIRLKGLKDGMDLSTDEQEDEKDVGDIEEDDEDDIFK